MNHWAVMIFGVIMFIVGFVAGLNMGVAASMEYGSYWACRGLKIQLIYCYEKG